MVRCEEYADRDLRDYHLLGFGVVPFVELSKMALAYLTELSAIDFCYGNVFQHNDMVQVSGCSGVCKVG